jgi:hypothetical protein
MSQTSVALLAHHNQPNMLVGIVAEHLAFEEIHMGHEPDIVGLGRVLVASKQMPRRYLQIVELPEVFSFVAPIIVYGKNQICNIT